MRDATSSIDKGAYVEPQNMLLSSWLEAWLKDFCIDLKPRTRSLYESTVRSRIIPALGNVKLSKLTTPIIQRFYTSCIDGNNSLSSKTVHNIHGVLHKALQHAVDIKYLSSNPSDACILPRVDKKEMRPLDETEMRLFLDAIQGDTFENLFKVALFTGMRQGEIMGLRWSDVDFHSGTIRIVQQLQQVKGKYIVSTPKNGRFRTIMPAPVVMDTLKLVHKTENDKRITAGGLWRESGYVFTNDTGEHIARNTLRNHFNKIAANIGLPDLRFHDLRHTYAVLSLRAGDDIKTLSENLGHATVTFTLDVYGHVTSSMKRESSNRMQAYLDSLSK